MFTAEHTEHAENTCCFTTGNMEHTGSIHGEKDIRLRRTKTAADRDRQLHVCNHANAPRSQLFNRFSVFLSHREREPRSGR